MNQIKIGSILSYIQMACSMVITLFYTPIMIQLLGNNEYGLYNTVSSVISIIALLNLGLGSSYIRYYSELKNKGDIVGVRKLNGMFFSIFSFIALTVLICGIFLINNLQMVFSTGLTEAEYVTARRLFAILIINLAISLPMNVFTCIINAHERFVFYKLLSVLKTVASPLLTLPILLLGYRSVGMVFSTLVIAIICDVFYLIYVFVVLKERFLFNHFDKKIFKEIFSYTVFIAIHLIVDQVNWHLDKVVLGRYKGTYEVALYSVGASLAAHYTTVGTACVSMFTPRIHGIVSGTQGNMILLREKLTAVFNKVGKIQYLIVAPIAIGFLFWGSDFISYWVGDEYKVTSYYVAVLLIFPGTIDIIQNLGIEIQRAQRLHKFRAVIYAAMALINIVLSVILCQNYGAIGCAIGTAISFVVVQGIVLNIYLGRKCNVDVVGFWKNILYSSKVLVLPTIFGLICKFARPQIGFLEMILQIGVFCAIYVFSLFIFELTYNEKAYIKNILKKRERK